MSITATISIFLAKLFFERPAAKQSITELVSALEAGGREGVERIAAAPDTEKNRERLRHIIAIERWGQNRLQTPPGTRPQMDESDDYYPPEGLALPELGERFREARAETVAQARALQAQGVNGRTLPHNQYGEMTVRGWLYYLESHAARDVKGVT
ncbi:MAG: DinB family protein [Candidatus Promineifilaceae bacterium]|nr:DinB family protein [Candidatus Promineifilaceae bacterium]